MMPVAEAAGRIVRVVSTDPVSKRNVHAGMEHRKRIVFVSVLTHFERGSGDVKPNPLMSSFVFLLGSKYTLRYALASTCVFAVCILSSKAVAQCTLLFFAVCAVFFTTYFSRWFVALALAAFLDIATNFLGVQRGLSLVVVFVLTNVFLFLSLHYSRVADLRAAVTTAIYGVIWPFFVYDTTVVRTREFSKTARMYYNCLEYDNFLVFVHGGGWCTGDIQDWLGYRLASLCNSTVVLVTYPKCTVPVKYVLRTYGIIAAAALPVAVFAASYAGTFFAWLVVALPLYAWIVYMLSLRAFEYTGQKSYYKEQVDSVTQTLDDLRRKFPQAKFSFVGHSAGAALLLSYIVGRLEADKPIGGKYALLSGPYDFVEMQKHYNSSHFANVFGTLTLEWVSPLHRLARCNRYVLPSSEAVYAVTSQSDFPFLNKQSTALATTWTSVVRVVLDSERGHGMGMISDDRVWKKVIEMIM